MNATSLAIVPRSFGHPDQGAAYPEVVADAIAEPVAASQPALFLADAIVWTEVAQLL